MSQSQWTRRQILRAGAAAAAAPYIVPAHVLGRGNAAPPSETVRVGVIGCGGRARVIREAADVKGFRVVAACDCVRRPRRKICAGTVGRQETWGVYDDFREMIEKEKLDGVMVETTTHARAWITIHAMQMGMDAYIEKPMCLTIAEGRAMVNAAQEIQVESRKSGRNSVRCRSTIGPAIWSRTARLARSTPCWRPTSWARSAGPRPRLPMSRGPVEHGGTPGPTRRNFVPGMLSCKLAGPNGGTTTEAGCASE